MKFTLLAVGKLKGPFTAAEAHYRKLLSRHQPVDVVEVRDDPDLLRKLPREARIVAFDQHGRSLDSMAWSSWLDERRLEARDVSLLIGGPDGLPEGALAAADERISL